MPATPGQMFDHALDFLKGWPSPHAVDATGKYSSNNDATCVPNGGRVAHFNSSKEFELGAKGTQMPIFLIQSATDFDVSNPSNSGPHAWYAIAPTGVMSGLVASGAYELESTEFEQATGVTYNPNDILHSPTQDQITGADKSAAGLIYKRKGWPGGSNAALVLYTDSVCAIVSRGQRQNHHRVQVLAFWPVYLPSASA